jgi:hypothetical protein
MIKPLNVFESSITLIESSKKAGMTTPSWFWKLARFRRRSLFNYTGEAPVFIFLWCKLLFWYGPGDIKKTNRFERVSSSDQYMYRFCDAFYLSIHYLWAIILCGQTSIMSVGCQARGPYTFPSRIVLSEFPQRFCCTYFGKRMWLL